MGSEISSGFANGFTSLILDVVGSSTFMHISLSIAIFLNFCTKRYIEMQKYNQISSIYVQRLLLRVQGV
jgi:hypothetical protein